MSPDARSSSTRDNSAQLITAAQVSITLGVSLRTLLRWRKCGIGPPWVRIGPKAIRYDIVEATRYLERNGSRQVAA